MLVNDAPGGSTVRKCYQPLADVLIIHERDEILVRNVGYKSMEHSFKQHKPGFKTCTSVNVYTCLLNVLSFCLCLCYSEYKRN